MRVRQGGQILSENGEKGFDVLCDHESLWCNHDDAMKETSCLADMQASKRIRENEKEEDK